MGIDNKQELTLLYTTIKQMEKESLLKDELIDALKEQIRFLESHIDELTSTLEEILDIRKENG